MSFKTAERPVEIPLMILGPEREILYCSDAMTSVFAAAGANPPPKRCVDAELFDICRGDCPALAVFSAGETRRTSAVAKSRKEEATSYLITASPVKGGAEKTMACLVALRDVGAGERAEHKLDVLKELSEKSTSSVIILREDGHIVYANRAAVDYTGYSLAELVKRGIFFFPPAWAGRLLEAVHQTASGRSVSPFEAEIVTRGGEVRKVEISLSFCEDNAGSATFYVVMNDITSKAELIEKLIKVKEGLEYEVAELKFLAELAEVLIGTARLDEMLSLILVAVTAGQGLGFNRAFLLLLENGGRYLRGRLAVGPSDPEEAGRIWSQLDFRHQSLRQMLESIKVSGFHGDARVNEIAGLLRISMDDEDNILVRALREKKTYNIDDAYKWGESVAALADLLGSGAFVVIPLFTSRDKPLGILLADNMINKRPITDVDVEKMKVFSYYVSYAIERSMLYQELEEQVEKLNEVNEDLKKNKDRLVRAEKLSAIGEMAAEIAHEIKNPLVAIGGFARYVLRRMSPGDKNRSYLEIVVNEVERLERILKNVLDFVKPMRFNFVNTDITLLIRQTVNLMHGELEESDIRVNYHLDESLPRIDVDPDGMIQVFVNVLRNAVQAMPGGGEIDVRSSLQDGIVVIEVEDTGCGIPEGGEEKIFEPFYTSGRGQGLGLGLTICSQILQGHGGRMKIGRSARGGSIARIELPLRRNGGV